MLDAMADEKWRMGSIGQTDERIDRVYGMLWGAEVLDFFELAVGAEAGELQVAV